MPARKPSRALRSDRVPLVLTVIVAVTPALVSSGIESPQWWALLACGIAFVALGLVDHGPPDEVRLTPRLSGYFLLQATFLAGIFAITRFHDMSVLAAFPLVGQAVICLPTGAAAIFITALYAAILGGGALMGSARDLPTFAASVLAGFAFVVVFMRIAVREKSARAEAERLSAELTGANEQLRAQAANIEELAMSRERNRVAREIHDSLGHALTTIAVQLEVAGAMHATEPGRALGAVNKAHVLAHEALADVRRSVGTLRAEGGAPPLTDRLRELTVCDEQLALSFALLGTPRRLAAEIEHGLFRAAQEGLTNVRRHAAAKSAKLTLDYREESRVTVSVADNGRGSAVPGNGYGLTGLHERAVLLGGTLTAADRPEGGFELRAEMPG